MRLIDILEDVSPFDLKRVEKALDNFVYQPEDKLKKSAPVLDVDIPTSKENHFVQRLNQRGNIADITLGDVYNLLKSAKTDPSIGVSSELDKLSRVTYPNKTVTIQNDDEYPLTIPVIVKDNPEAVKVSDNIPVGLDKNGKRVPKNKIIPKTVFRKGIDD